MNPSAALRAVLSRLLLASGLAAAATAIWIVATGGGRVSVAGARLSLTSPGRALFAAAVCLLAAAAIAPRGWRDELRAISRDLPRRAAAIAVACACLTNAAGIVWGSFVAGGADASGYLSQAMLWREGRLAVEQPIVAESPWPVPALTWTPLGFRPAADDPIAMVPTYPPGLPLLMAAAQIAAGFCGAFLVVPLCGGLVVLLTYLLGRRLFMTDPAPALWGALLLATSPAFLFQLMNPMSDVPVTAAWTLALVLLIDGRPLLAGLAMSAAVAIRPNLVPVAVVPLAWLALQDRKAAVLAGAGLVPAVAGVALVNARLYGSPLLAGYGSARDLYDAGNLWPNVRLYWSWLRDAETPLVFLAVLFFVAPPLGQRTSLPRARLLLGGMIAAVLMSYLFYIQFDSWTYLRFLLPVWPIVMLLAAASAVAILRRLPAGLFPAAVAVVIAAAAWHSLDSARRHFVFTFGESERKYGDVARYVSGRTERDAVMISMQHSGSLRLYTGRATLRYDQLDPMWLDRAVDFLIARGRHPYIVLDQWEVEAFSRRFAAGSRVGQLGWQPIATLATRSTVTYVYDAAGLANQLPPSAIPSSGRAFQVCFLPE